LLALILYVAAFVCFLIAAFGRPVVRFNIMALGLALWVLVSVLDGLSVGVK
jgi:hypothetical protein